MRVTKLAAYLAIGLTTIGCINNKAKKPDNPQVASKTDFNDKASTARGALEDGTWETVSQEEQLSLYKVKLGGKNITVIASWHTKPGVEALKNVLKEVEKDPANWSLLTEGLDYVDEITPELKGKVGMAKNLPDAGDGIVHIINTKMVSPEEMALAYVCGRLDRIARGINIKESDKTNPLEKVCEEAETNLREENAIAMKKEKIKRMVLNATSTQEKLEKAVKSSNDIVLGLAVQESDKMIARVVREALEGDEQNYLIYMGEGHLRSLVSSGPLAEYTKKLLDKVKTDPEFVKKALEMSKANDK